AMASPRCKAGARRGAAHSRGWQGYGTCGPATNMPHEVARITQVQTSKAGLGLLAGSPAGQPPVLADRVQPGLPGAPYPRRGHDEQAVPLAQSGLLVGYEPDAVPQNQGHRGPDRQPELIDVNAVEPGPGGYLHPEQVGAHPLQRGALHEKFGSHVRLDD